MGNLKAQKVSTRPMAMTRTANISLLAHSKRNADPPSLPKLAAMVAKAQSGLTTEIKDILLQGWTKEGICKNTSVRKSCRFADKLEKDLVGNFACVVTKQVSQGWKGVFPTPNK